ncbi:MAG: DUF3667 domain-containing protein [Acidobacteria bacterium]|nr:DUF3667 domain-containing protein [Acidobacteriota bacterium]
MHEIDISGPCLNCGTELHGKFCSSCGQRVASPKLGLHDVLHEAIHEFLHVDGKLFRTMRLLLFNPGRLTLDFVEGRRARHISPIRLYLLWSVLCFAVVAYFGFLSNAKVRLTPSAASRVATEGAGSGSLTARLAHGVEKVKEDPKRLSEALVHSLPKAMFLLMPVFALLLMLFYRKAQPYYVPHLYFSIHLHAFAFCLLSSCLLLGATGIALVEVVSLFLLGAVIPYFLLALRTVYGGAWGKTLAKGATMIALYFVLLNVGIVIVIGVTLLTI